MDSRNRLSYYLLTALSLSIGWGIRGNFGHEYGAMIPGALAAMAAVLLSGRADWVRDAPFFAMFGALGWSFGGSISYMQVIAYTHSGHSPSVLYGFACLFVIGFLWAALGGAGTALPAVAGPRRLAELLFPLGLVFVFWWLQGLVIEPWLRAHGYGLDWYDTDWLAALLAMVAALILVVFRGGVDRSTSLILHLAGGWWVGFSLLVLVLGLRMTPPRGDNWAGCVGMTAGAIVYCMRTGLAEVVRAALVSGFIGGIGFAGASMLKLVEVQSGYETNWHSILEQIDGVLQRDRHRGCLERAGATGRPGSFRGFTRGAGSRQARLVAVGFVVLAIPYLNLRKNVSDWTRAGAVPQVMYGIPAWAWFDLASLAVAACLIILMIRHSRRPLALVPENAAGPGPGPLSALPGHHGHRQFRASTRRVQGPAAGDGRGDSPQRPALHADRLDSRSPGSVPVPVATGNEPVPTRWGRLVAIGLGAALIAVLADWAIVRGIYGDRFAGHAGLHIRFGPNATTSRPGR